MKILIITDEPVRLNFSAGNTFLNLFAGMEDVELANVFTRIGQPDSRISKSYCITETMIVKSIISNKSPGLEVQPGHTDVSNVKRHRWFSFFKRTRLTIFFLLQNLIWRTNKWKSNGLKEFVEEYNPDIVFTFLSNCEYLNNLILHIKKITQKKLVIYAWDNNYSLKRFILSPLRWIKFFIDRIYIRKVAKESDLFYVISDVQKEDYEKSFKRECKLLTKSADFNGQPEPKTKYNSPLQLVYTGNIGLNRWKSLANIANVLEKINENGTKAQLRIYTGNELTSKMNKALNRGESSFVIGSVSAEKVIELQKNADILVHVEAVDLKNKLLVRQSFSTKIVDYLAAARPILAFGPKSVASIDHLIKNDCAIVADNETELLNKLSIVISNKDELQRLASKAYDCGKEHHNKSDIHIMLKKDLETLSKF